MLKSFQFLALQRSTTRTTRDTERQRGQRDHREQIPYEVFMPENEAQEQENTQSDDAPQMLNANTRNELFDPNVMFVPCCTECGVEAGENVTLYGCNYDGELYCTLDAGMPIVAVWRRGCTGRPRYLE